MRPMNSGHSYRRPWPWVLRLPPLVSATRRWYAEAMGWVQAQRNRHRAALKQWLWCGAFACWAWCASHPVAAHARPRRSAPRIAAPAPSHGATAVDTPLFDPSGKALLAWQAALQRVAAGQGQARALFYGASHTAADVWTGELRRRWQGRWGEAGHGFFLPAKWNVGYRQQDMVVEASRGWTILRHKREDGGTVGDYGLLGVAMESHNPEEFAEIRTTVEAKLGRRFDLLEVWPRLQRDGGDLVVTIDGQAHTVPTRDGSAAVVTWKLADTPHQVRIQPAGNGSAGLYGVVTERARAGVVLDQLGIPGMRASIHLHWREDRWAEQAARRKPDLVVLAYGTNDLGADSDEPMDAYAQSWRKVLQRLRRAAPQAACVIVGPTDRLLKDSHGLKVSAPRTAAVIETQRRVAAEMGCAHWDARAAMGGDGAMLRWQALGWATRDDVHLTREGYVKLAELFDAALHGRTPR